MGGLNTICIDDGYVEIDNENHCKLALKNKGFEYDGVITESFIPRGCSTEEEYNSHPVGSRHEEALPICIAPGNISYL